MKAVLVGWAGYASARGDRILFHTDNRDWGQDDDDTRVIARRRPTQAPTAAHGKRRASGKPTEPTGCAAIKGARTTQNRTSSRTVRSAPKMASLVERVAPLARATFGPILLTALTVAWFLPIRQGAIAFDDVGAVLRWTDPQVGLLDRTALDVSANRWRPVFSTLFTLMTGAFGRNYAAYFWFNVALILALVLLVYWLVLRLSSSATLATAIAAIAVTSRFAYYQVTQAIGLLEGLSLVFLVLLIGVLVRFERSERVDYLGWAVVLYALIIHTHERYAVLLVFLISLILTTRSLTIRTKLLWCGAFAAPLVLNIAIRHFVFHLPLLVGTGSSSELGFTLPTAVKHYALSVLNVVGINSGPGYLDGLVYPFLPGPYRAASVALVVLFLLALGAAFAGRVEVRGNWLTSPGPRRNIMLGILLVMVLILSFSVTIRVEPRWLYAPFLVVLLLFAYSLSLIANSRSMRPPVVAAMVIFLALSVVLDRKYGENLDGVYFMAARADARLILEQTIGRHGEELTSRPIYVIDSTEGANWQVTLSSLVLANSEIGPLAVTTVPSAADVPVGVGAFVYDVTGGFHEFQYPATGFLAVGDFYADGWVGVSFGIRGRCESLTLTIRPFRPGPDRYVTITTPGTFARRYPLSQPALTVVLTGQQLAGGLGATFDRAFTPLDEGVGQDVRSLAARVSIDCTPPVEG